MKSVFHFAAIVCSIFLALSSNARAEADQNPCASNPNYCSRPEDTRPEAMDAIQDALQDYADDHPDDAYAQALLNTYVQQVDHLAAITQVQDAAQDRGDQSRADFYSGVADRLATQLATDPVSVLPPSLWNYGLHHHVPVLLGGPID